MRYHCTIINENHRAFVVSVASPLTTKTVFQTEEEGQNIFYSVRHVDEKAMEVAVIEGNRIRRESMPSVTVRRGDFSSQSEMKAKRYEVAERWEDDPDAANGIRQFADEL